MLNEQEKDSLNYTLAIGYLIMSIQLKGEEETMKEIDKVFDVPSHRLYIRSLLSDALKIMKEEKIED